MQIETTDQFCGHVAQVKCFKQTMLFGEKTCFFMNAARQYEQGTLDHSEVAVADTIAQKHN